MSNEDTQCHVDGCTNEAVSDWAKCWDCFVQFVDGIEFEQSVDEAKANVITFFDGDKQ